MWSRYRTGTTGGGRPALGRSSTVIKDQEAWVVGGEDTAPLDTIVELAYR